MERSQGSNWGNDQNRDTSQPGREESVVNQQDQHRTTNSQENNETTNRPTGEANRGNSGEQDYSRGQNDSMGDRSYREGQQDNDLNQDTPPEIGKDDADKTQRETPRM